MSAPIIRPRRLRRLKAIRDLVAETHVTPSDLILPVFVKEGLEKPEPIPSMPGIYRYPVSEHLVKHVQEALDLGVKAIILFGIPKEKDDLGSSAWKKDGVVQQALRLLRKEVGEEAVLITDVCLCQYTTHGHCGVVRPAERGWIVENDETLDILGRIAVSHAEAGADVVAPSGMMDGMVAAIREALDEAGFTYVAILSYAVKYASSFYGPFREAAYSAPKFGDRRGYQMDPRNALEALREAGLDIDEGADMLMVKPALPYLDVIRLVKSEYPYMPLAAYNVSGEYSMVKAAAEKGWIDERKAIYEILHAIKRAGADMILTYHALEYAKLYREGYSPF